MSHPNKWKLYDVIHPIDVDLYPYTNVIYCTVVEGGRGLRTEQIQNINPILYDFYVCVT